MKKLVTLLLLPLLFSSLSACSSNADSGNTGEASSSLDPSGSSGSVDVFYAASIPQDLYYEGEHYKMEAGTLLSEDEIASFLGYFVNLDDLDKWEERDQSDSIVYVTDPSNSIYNHDPTGKLSNRFELYLTTSDSQIALKSDGVYCVYEVYQN